MTDKPTKPLLSSAAQADAAVREARRAAALRANLRRRKTQDQAREASIGTTADPAAVAPAEPQRGPAPVRDEDAAACETSMRDLPSRREE